MSSRSVAAVGLVALVLPALSGCRDFSNGDGTSDGGRARDAAVRAHSDGDTNGDGPAGAADVSVTTGDPINGGVDAAGDGAAMDVATSGSGGSGSDAGPAPGSGGGSAGGRPTGGGGMPATGSGGTAGPGTGGAATASGGSTSPPGTGGAVASGGRVGGTGGAATGGAATGGAGTGGAGTGGAGTGGAGPSIAYTANVIFVTSAAFSVADLATKGGGTGAVAVLAGADKACAEAVASPFSRVPAGKYVAWMSSMQSNAIDRLKAAAGGTAPRGWQRVDGRPFLDTIPSTNEGYPDVLYPVTFDETGNFMQVAVRTATDSFGHVNSLHCNNWTSVAATDSSGTGVADAGLNDWTQGYARPCSEKVSLYCMQVDKVTVVPHPTAPANAKRIFVSTTWMPANGIAGADARCATDAIAANLSGTFRALLATSTASAASRFHPTGTRPYARLDGVIVAAKDTDLLQANPVMLAPNSVSAMGVRMFATTFAGAANITAVGTQTCGDWTIATTASTSSYGSSTFVRTGFFSGFSDNCTRGYGLHCLED